METMDIPGGKGIDVQTVPGTTTSLSLQLYCEKVSTGT